MALVAAAGCVTAPPSYPVKKASEYRYKATKEGVTVAIEPVFDRAVLFQYFKLDLMDRGILPVLLVLQNDSPNASYLLVKTNCVLAQAVGLASKDDLPTRRLEGFFWGGEGTVAEATSVRTNLADKELNDQTVSPGESVRGFVYMKIPKKRPAKGADTPVLVRLLNPINQLNFDLPITWER